MHVPTVGGASYHPVSRLAGGLVSGEIPDDAPQFVSMEHRRRGFAVSRRTR